MCRFSCTNHANMDVELHMCITTFPMQNSQLGRLKLKLMFVRQSKVWSAAAASTKFSGVLQKSVTTNRTVTRQSWSLRRAATAGEDRLLLKREGREGREGRLERRLDGGRRGYQSKAEGNSGRSGG